MTTTNDAATLDDALTLEALVEEPKLPDRNGDDAGERGCIQLPGALLGDPVGRVVGYMQVSKNLSWHPSSARFLPEGRSMKVSEDRAIMVMMPFNWGNGQPIWRNYQFPVGGELHGPLVWAEGTAAPWQDLIEMTTEYNTWVYGGMFAGVVAGPCVVIAAAHLWGSEGLAQSLLDGTGDAFAWTLAGASMTLVGVIIGAAVGCNVGMRWIDKAKALAKMSHNSIRCGLNPRIKDMIDYLPKPDQDEGEVGQAPKISVDVQVARALAEYRPLWRKAEARKETLERGVYQMLAHSAALIGNIAKRIRSEPDLLQSDEVRSSFRNLIERAKGDVEKALEKQLLASETSVLTDIKMLERQLDERLGTPCKETAA